MQDMPLGPLMVDIAGLELTQIDRELLTHPLIGSVIIFARNFQTKQQVTCLVDEIKHLRNPPLLVAVDQEGGRVQRFKTDFYNLPPLIRLGHLYDQDKSSGLVASRQLARLMAYEVAATGVDFSFAPVVDQFDANSQIIADRAFHQSPQAIAELSCAYIQGLHDLGMIAVAKHFPGHGGVLEDSHHCLPEDNRCFEQLNENDLKPYRYLINHGLDAILTAHVKFNQIESLPSGFSRFWIQTILREKLGFTGIVFTDDLSMEGAKQLGSINQRVNLAMQAGCDIALICNDRAAVEQVLDDQSMSQWLTADSQLEKRCRRECLLPGWQPDIDQIEALLDQLNKQTV